MCELFGFRWFEKILSAIFRHLKFVDLAQTNIIFALLFYVNSDINTY